MVPPRSLRSLPPEGAAAALGRPGGGGVLPTRSLGSLPPEGAAATLGRPGGGGVEPPRASDSLPPAPVLEIEGVSQTFGEGRLAVQALKPTSLAVQPGELVALLGPSGSGKSTLLLAISLIQPPTTGRIRIGGQLLYDQGPTGVDVRAFRRQRIGFIFQQHNLIPFLSAQENVALVLQLNGVGRREAARRALELLGYLEIAHRADALPARLSGGEQQRVAIGRALANQPTLILADEPTAALDTERGNKVMGLLRQIARERGSAVITVTHDHRMIEGFDTVYQLEDGRLVDTRRHGQPASDH